MCALEEFLSIFVDHGTRHSSTARGSTPAGYRGSGLTKDAKEKFLEQMMTKADAERLPALEAKVEELPSEVSRRRCGRSVSGLSRTLCRCSACCKSSRSRCSRHTFPSRSTLL
eukprot:2884379-Prymnesium_polylepis.1